MNVRWISPHGKPTSPAAPSFYLLFRSPPDVLKTLLFRPAFPYKQDVADWLTIHRLRLWTHLGVPEEERAHPQMVETSLRWKVESASEAAAQDDLALTINYYEVAQRAKAIAAARPRQLLETLAEDLAEGLLADFPFSRIEITLRKFILPDTESVELVIERKRRKNKNRKLRVLPAPTATPGTTPGDSTPTSAV